MRPKKPNQNRYKKPQPSEFSQDDIKTIGKRLVYFGLPPALTPAKDADKYDPTFHPPDLLKRLRHGETRAEVCTAWGISYTTFQDWVDTYPGISEALIVGRPAFEAYWRQAAKAAAVGQIHGVKTETFSFVLKNTIGWSEDGQDAMSDGANAELRFEYED